MVDLDLEQKAPSTAANMSTKKKELLSTAMKRTSEWIFSQEIPSDITVNAGGTSSLCTRKLVSESSDADLSAIEIPDVPGGAEAFELAAKFCYGINFEISTENIAMLRCVAEYLEMTEDYAVGNLVGRTEAYLNEVALKSLAGAVSVLHSSESFLPTAEKVKLVSRCIDTIAFVICKDSQFAAGGGQNDLVSSTMPTSKPIVDWWAEDLSVLRIDLFQRVLIAMIARGFKQYALGPILMLYAQKSLRGLDVFGKGRRRLSQDKNTRNGAAIYLETTVACRLDLEKRMASQLGQAVLDDLLFLLIPSLGTHEDYISPSPSDRERVTKLMENYLAEIASDRNLSVSKFISLAEIIPEQSRLTEDGMYRAIDIYLKAHPALSDMERKKVCSVMDCQKLSREACAHAAQNDRLPVQTVVQVLYYEQQRLREVMDGNLTEAPALPAPSKLSPYSIDVHPVNDEVSTLRRENQDLKLELVKMKMRLKEMEKPLSASSTPSPLAPARPMSSDKPPLPRKSFISSVGKKLGRFIRADGISPQTSKGRTKPAKDRRHSIS
ncbi:BTB/POZ domain-containing protein IP1 [Sesamum angolense]|uniref:BTB/POZ domain-containing protein IP1 n=1 Tax=Sesamum angolense TaxID=2727404 RepID=A0AAE2BQ10_9LAMI|nr:BTB/POZ domain-containing protein IP1 [Sesamum angolense]